jgi:endonuclease/exonuclease/phosphatase family metal-dependent hydrolase
MLLVLCNGIFRDGYSQKLSYRNEEGVMILSKFPIVDYEVILLPRKMDDTRY